MEVIETVKALQQRADEIRRRGERIALVPTMGALHRGHLALVHEARRRAEVVIVSVFVNPTQFGAGEDFDAYPRTLASDVEGCEAAGADLVFAPDVAELYPPGAQTRVRVEEISKPLCGASRPVHFEGVATIVTKLLLAAKPHCAVFGLKDFQQVAVLRRLVADLCFDVEIVGVPTVREPDGVAMSSRNHFLDAETRPQATVLVRALRAAEAAVAAGERRREALLALVHAEIAKAPLAEVDYAGLRDPASLEAAPARLAADTLLALAVCFPVGRSDQRVRLIDNTVLAVAARPPEDSR